MKTHRFRPATLIVIGATATLVGTLLFAPFAGAQPPSSTPAPILPPGLAGLASARVCSDPGPGEASCTARVIVDGHGAPLTNANPVGYGPTQFQSAYNLTAAAATNGGTIALVDAYDNPYAESNLATYRSTEGLPPCTTANGCFKKVKMTRFGRGPSGNSGWGLEESLDLDAASAVCPKCSLVLVEAYSASFTDLGNAENTAASLGAKSISNSYGGNDGAGESAYDSYYNHPGVAITASTGDTGFQIEYPSSSPYVTAVGGTTLQTSTNARGWVESAWNSGGSGCSKGESQPTWQAAVSTLTAVCAMRATADVSADANPNTGAAVYDTYGYGGWILVGGTSLASPLVAGVYALAGNTASVTNSSYPYLHGTSANLNDVTSGTNGSCGNALCTAGAGWDGPTGLGTPNGTGAF
ncbi:MAG TPA: S53 family peptidase [Actinomycetota bacterium]|nr:S53 family peptidase [Actinomycetota bacterium]